MTAQDVRENSTKTVPAGKYFELSLVSDGWVLVDKHAWQILMMTRKYPDRYILYVWNPVKNVVKRAVILPHCEVWITEGDE